MRITLNPNSLDDYRTFLAIKALPTYRFVGREAIIPDEYAAQLGVGAKSPASTEYRPIPGLFDYQRDITGIAIEKRKFAVFAQCGLGKALRYDEPVLTPDGWRPIGSLSIGDEVIGSGGFACNVIGVYPQGVRPLYRVTFNDGITVTCDADHLWYVQTQGQRYDGRQGRVLSTQQIIEIGLTDGLGRHRHFVPLVDAVERPDAALPIDPYTLGVLIGDGTLHSCPALTTVDSEILGCLELPDRIIPKLKAEGGGKAPTYYLSGSKGRENALVRHLDDLGLWGRRSWEKFIPRVYLQGSIPQRRALLAGLIDTDGSVCGGTVEFVTTSRQLADDVAELVQSLGGVAPIREKRTTYTYLGIKRSGRLAYRLNIKLPRGECPFRLARKRAAWTDKSKEPHRAIIAIEPAGEDQAVCIAVDAPDRLYVTRGHVLTHNTLILLEFARHAQRAMGPSRRVLIVSPLMVIPQTIEAVQRFYGDKGPGDFGIEQVRAKDLPRWTTQAGSWIGITNYEALTDAVPQGRLGALILDESSMLKSHYGKHGQQCLRLGAGLEWKLCLTGTPAPNDRIEYANHAVFLDAFPTVNSFLARYFVNRGQTGERWELKPHALEPFYRSLSHWCIFLENPATYGWKDNTANIPPIHVHIHDVDLTAEQRELVGQKMGTLFAADIGGITKRSTLSQIAKGNHKGRKVETNKPAFIRDLVASWHDESTIVWCLYNAEQEALEAVFPDAASISGSTPIEKRWELIADFQAGRRKVLISKPSVLGFGLNLQVATRQVFSGLQDSFEEYHQAVKRSNRIGSTRPLNVHIPVSDVERPMIETVLRKAHRVQQDTEIQERLFREQSLWRANHVA